MLKSAAHTRITDGKKHIWSVEDLWKLSSSLPIQTASPDSMIDLDREGWFSQEKPTPRLVLKHMKRILDADLDHPVILDFDGSIMDGAH